MQHGGLEGQRRRDCQIGVGRLPASAGARLGPPRGDRLRREPHGQAAASAQARIVLGPVGHPVLLLGNVVATGCLGFERHGRGPSIREGAVVLHRPAPDANPADPCNKVARNGKGGLLPPRGGGGPITRARFRNGHTIMLDIELLHPPRRCGRATTKETARGRPSSTIGGMIRPRSLKLSGSCCDPFPCLNRKTGARCRSPANSRRKP
jgi:hypothetical protein